MELREVVSGGLRDSDFHGLRGFGLGSSFGLPQLPIHALTSSQATPISALLELGEAARIFGQSFSRPGTLALGAHPPQIGGLYAFIAGNLGKQS